MHPFDFHPYPEADKFPHDMKVTGRCPGNQGNDGCLSGSIVKLEVDIVWLPHQQTIRLSRISNKIF